jgi:serine/threonine protein phosphatase 1
MTDAPTHRFFGLNERGGVDYLVADLHGDYRNFLIFLFGIGFDPERDRIFVSGDLVDRGLWSWLVARLLALPCLFSTRGNHDEMAGAHLMGLMRGKALDNHIHHGGQWCADLMADEDPEGRMVIAEALRSLPTAISLMTAKGKVGIVHSDCPSRSWSRFLKYLDDPVRTDEVHREALVDRTRFKERKTTPVNDVRAVFTGHTRVRYPTNLGNVILAETAGWSHNGVYTVLCADTLNHPTHRPRVACGAEFFERHVLGGEPYVLPAI